MSAMSNTTHFQPPSLKLYRLNSNHHKPTSSLSSPPFPIQRLRFQLRKERFGNRNGAFGNRAMFELVKASAFGSGDNGDEGVQTLEQEALVDGSPELHSSSLANRLESVLNRLSKWVISALFAGIIIWKHDGEAIWAAMGSIINAILSIVLKKIINQERPVTASKKSDPGMPSSHSQSIFFIVTFSIISIVEGLGVNGLTLAISGLALAFGSYLAWLRVSQRLHTVSQVVVGAVVGLTFAISWYWFWNAVVLQAFESSLWVRIVVILGAAVFGVGFAYYVFKNWLKDD